MKINNLGQIDTTINGKISINQFDDESNSKNKFSQMIATKLTCYEGKIFDIVKFHDFENGISFVLKLTPEIRK